MGDRWAAQEHRRRGDAHKSVMEELDRRAAKIIFRENNKDLGESVDKCSRIVHNRRTNLGKGLHSDAGGARIRPALEVLCTEQGLDHSLHPNNAGVLVVRLD
ncbi:hypothetical protein EDB92DRAFT_1863877 [Lactarius akahatsu]|uniref:DUF1771 domain-containing protein n=1 Tax=Lactarius akahatsu TaxID=416441 RepID=A0AAD4LGS2_9AGAM|nr:hypothetical protein EDB92DRAFT_1863877 [Lactarius akahatsu]